MGFTPVILAGGSGTRLWPLSRQHYAKQFLALDGAHTLLQQTVMRLKGLAHDAPMILCNEETRFLAAEQMRQAGVDGAQILLEPAGRNTAPAIALAALHAMKGGHDPVLLVMPADHVVRNKPAFDAAVTAGLAQAKTGALVTFGIVPDRAETGYGYIKTGQALGGAFAVERFVEKPDTATAQTYLESGDYYWNSGIFMFRASAYLDELMRTRPDIANACKSATRDERADLDFIRFDATIFLACPAQSVDYAVMEQTDKAVMVPMDAGWSDIGSWAALWAASAKTPEGNCEIGDVLSLDGQGNYINAGSRLVAAVGLHDMVVVETKDTVFVAPKARVDEVKALVAKLQDRPEAHHHREVYRPWGRYDLVDSGPGYQVKRITVNPGARLSLQKHRHRAEHWVVVRGVARVTRGAEKFLLRENQSTFIPLGEVHALANPGKEPLELIEVQSGSYLGEDDIIRLKDDYGRASGPEKIGCECRKCCADRG